MNRLLARANHCFRQVFCIMAAYERSCFHPEWDSWDADVAEANENVQEEETHNKAKRQRTATHQGKNGDGKILNGICSDENIGLGVLIELTVVLKLIVCILELHAK